MKKVPSIPYKALPHFSDAERLERVRGLREELATRRTCRMFADTPVAREIIEEAILAAGTAPSGAHHQPWHDLQHRALAASGAARRGVSVGLRHARLRMVPI